MDTPNPALDALERDIAKRLSPVCSHMSAEIFKSLVSDIARVKMKYGLQSMATEQLSGAIADVVILARVTTQENDAGSGPR
ncbi:MAG: hypothetical protein ABIW94_00045 [Gemmatimonadaceae bacterium]